MNALDLTYHVGSDTTIHFKYIMVKFIIIAFTTFLIAYFVGVSMKKGIVTSIYGPGGSGKTNICMLALIRMAGSGKKIIYIDTESSFSVERLQQVTRYYEKVLQKTIFFQPQSFVEQDKVFKDLPEIITKKIGLVIVDTISMLYRLEMSQSEDFQNTNAALTRQIATLIKCARENRLPVLVTNQVYADFNHKDSVQMVGGDILKNGSRCIIELKTFAAGYRQAHLHKHRSLPERTVNFNKTEKGIEKKE